VDQELRASIFGRPMATAPSLSDATLHSAGFFNSNGSGNSIHWSIHDRAGVYLDDLS